MMVEQTYKFLSCLVDMTKNDKIEWKPFSSYKWRKTVYAELENGCGDFDYSTNTIKDSASYYFKYKNGYVFLFEIYHGDSDVTSPQWDTLALMVKVDNVMPLQNITDYNSYEMQSKLKTLRLLVEYNIEQKYNLPDALYNFMNEIINNNKSDWNSEDNEVYCNITKSTV